MLFGDESRTGSTIETACISTITAINSAPIHAAEWTFLRSVAGTQPSSGLVNTNELGGLCVIAKYAYSLNDLSFLDASCACLSGEIIDMNATGTSARCISSLKTLTLTPSPNQKDPRPKGTETKHAKSTYELIAKVTEGGQPKAGVAVTFGVDADYASGGHVSHTGTRPTGTVPPSGNTDANGEFKFQFQAGEFSGTEKITATCDTCSNKTATHDLTVKVPDLVSLQADSAVPPRYTLAGNTSPVGVKHKGNHYFTASALNNLSKLINHFNSFAWRPVAINDASIVWGG